MFDSILLGASHWYCQKDIMCVLLLSFSSLFFFPFLELSNNNTSHIHKIYVSPIHFKA